MKRKRLKHVKKTLAFYKNNFGFAPPYNVLLDGTFCKAALSYKVNISEQVPKYFDAEVRLCTTPCVLAECEALGTLLFGPLKVLRQFEKVPCDHAEPLPVAKCLHRMARKNKKSKRKFVIASQDPELSELVRKKAPGSPLLYIAFNAFCLEAPSEKSEIKADAALTAKLASVEHLTMLKKSILGETEEPKKRKKKKKRGPNPLSCKKSMKKCVQDGGKVEKKRNRKRHKRMNLPVHVKETLMNANSDNS